MKISIIGGGAMGSIYAALMAGGKNEITLIDSWAEHINTIKTKGLKVKGASGKRLIHNINASTDINEAKGSELYIISTKTSQVREVASQLKNFVKDGEQILTIQNGLGSGDEVAKYLNPKNIFIGVAEGFGASVMAPGQVHHNSMKLIRIGEMIEEDFSRVKELTKLWTKSGFKAKAFEDINQLVWEKFICNVTFSGPCTVFEITLGELMSIPEYWNVALNCMWEAYELGMKKSISFSFDDPVKYVTKFGKRMPKAKPSMLLDHEQKRFSEIGAINGMVVKLGKNMGMATPYNEVVTTIVTHKEKMMR